MAVEVIPDHPCTARKGRCVHLFISAPPKFSPAEIGRYFKGLTSRRLTQEFQSLRRQYGGANATLWTEGYYSGTPVRDGPNGVSAETIRQYIE